MRFVFAAYFLSIGLFAQAAGKPLQFQLNRLNEGQVVQVSQDSWSDKYLLIAIGYTGCPDICPTTLLDMREALKSLDQQPEQAQKLQPLFISIDPLSDSLSDITQYTAYFDPRIVGLHTSDFKTLDEVVKQLRGSYGYQFEGKPVYPPELPKGYTVYHSTYIYLYSPAQELLDVFPYNMSGEVLAEKILPYLTGSE